MEVQQWPGWHFDYEEALQAAKDQRKPILLQFHRERCSGCRKMYALTYPQEEVQQELLDWFLPLRLDILENRVIRSNYAAVWTPSFYFLDHYGKMYWHFPGYQNPEDFRVLMRLGKAALDIPRGRYLEIISLMEDGLQRFPDNPRAPSMLFQKGMAVYLKKWDREGFRAVMSEIIEKYPHSQEARMWPWMDEGRE